MATPSQHALILVLRHDKLREAHDSQLPRLVGGTAGALAVAADGSDVDYGFVAGLEEEGEEGAGAEVEAADVLDGAEDYKDLGVENEVRRVKDAPLSRFSTTRLGHCLRSG